MSSIEPWLTVTDATRALDFYRNVFGATELERMESEPGVIEVARLAIASGAFWISRNPDAPPPPADPPVRLIVAVEDPDATFARAITAGARPVAAVHEAHGWRVGRFLDPLGHTWEVARRA